MSYEVIEIVENTYAGLFLRIKEHWKDEKREVVVVDSHISSDRHTNKVYYVAVIRVGIYSTVEVGKQKDNGIFCNIFKKNSNG